MDREAQIVNAIEAYKTGQFKYIRQAAHEYNVHPSTLSRRLRGSTSIKEANATKQAVAPGEEKALLD
jgi:predicted ferric reductase